MMRLYGAEFASAVRLLGGMRPSLNCNSAMGSGNPSLLAFFIEKQVRPVLDDLPISQTVKNQLIILQANATKADDTPEHCRTLGTQLEVFLTAFQDDLSNVIFLTVQAKYRDVYEQSEPLFGRAVDETFAKAVRDIRDAGRCLALEQWTAAVFHLMRAAELALQRLARRLRLASADRASWGDLLKRLDGQIKHWENDPASPQRDKRLAYYSAARADFNAFNFAWRRYVAHGHESYDETEAMTVYTHVKALMERLARGMPR